MRVLVALLALLTSHAAAWGSLGHTTVAYLASSLVSPHTEVFFQALLNNDTDAYLARVATWADSYRYTASGRWSAALHYIDAEDDPPRSCSVLFDRDCGERGCVVSAVGNYTKRVVDPSLSLVERIIAAKFIIHNGGQFLGDLHQPLHDENLSIGGNGIHVNFSGKATNLHSVWDSAIAEKLVGGYSYVHAQAWAASLKTDIVSGIYKDHAPTWLLGTKISEPVETALLWATEANHLVCTAVLPDGVEAVSGKELSGEYYESAVPVVKLQVAKAGVRLAAWLDLIAGSIRTEL
ncbi:Nuclease S1-like protein 2 [Phlyctema vagabunda]|uniref:Nuclease S1-like protein 2 n=1 Tax=Phlyctema vagabunda TaxID=108571 RepID=A0ABR4PVJ9_9HELO